MDLVLIRHPAVAVAPGTCYGSSDVPLAADAAAGAAEIASRLAALQAPLPARIVTSPLARCARVAAALGATHGLDVRHDARLAEMDFGAWELGAWDAIAREQIDAWTADFLHARDHGGESVAQFDARVQGGFDALAGTLDDDAPVWAVAHAGVIRAIAARALGVPLPSCLRWPLEMAAIVWLRRAAEDDWRLVRWNA